MFLRMITNKPLKRYTCYIMTIYRLRYSDLYPTNSGEKISLLFVIVYYVLSKNNMKRELNFYGSSEWQCIFNSSGRISSSVNK